MNANTSTSSGQRSTEADYQLHIRTVQIYIQEHLDEPLPLEVLAAVAGFSPFHFHRIFAAFVGETLGEYVRRVRLQRAAQQLLDTAQSITEIAFASGYETPAAFTKAFRQAFAITPSKLRQVRERSILATFNRKQTKQRKLIMQAEIRTLPDQRVLYVRQKGIINGDFGQAAGIAFDKLYTYLGQHNMIEQGQACLGITPDEPGVVPPEECRFDAGIFLRDKQAVEIKADDSVAIQILQAGRYAVFLHTGPYNTVGQAWDAIYRHWLPTSGETLRDVPPYEVYLDNPQHTQPADLRTEIFVPIQ